MDSEMEKAEDFERIKRLPPYVFAVIDALKKEARARGEDIIDFGMGNPDQPPAAHVVAKLVETAQRKDAHRYSSSRGLFKLRLAISDWYKRIFAVVLDAEEEAIVTIGSKEGLSHLMLTMLVPGDQVVVPNPAYPIHPYGCVIAGADVNYVALDSEEGFLEGLLTVIHNSWPKPKMILLNFPSNPTTRCVELDFFEKIVAIAREQKIWIVHDLAYAELCFDGYRPPSILQVEGAKEIAVESYSLSKTYNMPGWRVGFICGNRDLIRALAKMKSYLDYGVFTPIQVAAIAALNGPRSCVDEVRSLYKSRRDVLCEGLCRIGWQVEKPKATMFVWAPIPEPYRSMGSLEFAKRLISRAGVATSPGIGFGKNGEMHLRFSLIENEQRIRQALRALRRALEDGL